MGFYLPVAVGWIMVGLFDSEQMREIFGTLVSASILGPFFIEWWAFGMYLFDGDDVGYSELMYYVWGSVWFAWTVFEMLVQIALVPQIMDWIDDAPIEDKTENLMTIIPEKAEKLLTIMDF